MTPTLYTAISYHGFGHHAQMAAVLNPYAQRHPELRHVLQSAAPRALLERYFHFPFEHVEHAMDFGMVMRNALEVDARSSHERYHHLHARWEYELDTGCRLLREFKPQLVLSNVPYLANAAAGRERIPNINLCSLNWADIYWPYCQDIPQAEIIYDQMRTSYARADRFYAPVPHMDMPSIDRVQTIGPIARLGRDRRTELHERSGYAGARHVLVSLGGVAHDIDYAQWPRCDDVVYLVEGAAVPARADLVDIQRLRLPYIDLVRSCDAFVIKPGYGSVTEAACNATPVLFVRRPDWPEEAALVSWMQQQASARELPRADFERGDLLPALDALWESGARPAVAATGIEDMMAVLDAYLRC